MSPTSASPLALAGGGRSPGRLWLFAGVALCTGGLALAAVATGLVGRIPREEKGRKRRRRGARDGEKGGEASEEEEEEEDVGELEDLATTAGTEPERPDWSGYGGVRRTVKTLARGGGSKDEQPRQAQLPGQQRIFIKTQGCAHNSSDSEFMMGLLRDYGYTFVTSLEEADAVVVNSCTVKNPSQDTATNLVKKAQESGKAVVLTGCVPTGDASIATSLEGVSMLGVTQIDRIVEVVEEAIRGSVVRLLGQRRSLPSLELPKVRRNSLVEIIPISGGCLGNCSYCKTKHARGKLLSYSVDAVVGRALHASSEGVSEVWLTSEDTGAYGIDLGTDIATLLRRVSDALPQGVMLKLGMTNPPYMLAHIEAVAEVMNRPNVFGFIHIPVQSGSDAVLQAMVREYTSGDFRRLVDGLRERVPNIMVATDVIAGFPSESEEDHRQTMALVEEYRFPVLNISQFYPRPGTAAARMRKLPTGDVKRRSTELTELFNSYETFQAYSGSLERVWFCETDAKRGQSVGHTKGYVKVVVPRDDALLGKSAMVRLGTATKWHVEGKVEASSA
eukprot:TRINITY_DN13309_c0_g1_i1.p1 TRINITY_DN13309_c0_g1~~TRINITY_DN13309_c0_g1_i1.p1  ORF type:complete len:560 (-),score=136.47 TRINITY_DN13309_c0_g1_i1:375-2054(-)